MRGNVVEVVRVPLGGALVLPTCRPLRCQDAARTAQALAREVLRTQGEDALTLAAADKKELLDFHALVFPSVHFLGPDEGDVADAASSARSSIRGPGLLPQALFCFARSALP